MFSTLQHSPIWYLQCLTNLRSTSWIHHSLNFYTYTIYPPLHNIAFASSTLTKSTVNNSDLHYLHKNSFKSTTPIYLFTNSHNSSLSILLLKSSYTYQSPLAYCYYYLPKCPIYPIYHWNYIKLQILMLFHIIARTWDQLFYIIITLYSYSYCVTITHIPFFYRKIKRSSLLSTTILFLLILKLPFLKITYFSSSYYTFWTSYFLSTKLFMFNIVIFSLFSTL